MTWVISLTSKPLDAKSVAQTSLALEVFNSFITKSLYYWDLSPWRDKQKYPFFVNSTDNSSQLRFVLANISTLSSLVSSSRISKSLELII